MSPEDILLFLSPPLRLCLWLETVFAAKQAKGEPIPESYVRWLRRWQRIRSELPCEVDVLTAEEWAALSEQVI